MTGYHEIPVGWQDKALWPVGGPVSASEFVSEERTLFDGSLNWPAMILRDSALRSNIRTLAGFAERHGMLFAPHGKTSMSPELFDRQLDAGAWGITVATAHQAMIALRFGVRRVLIAHQVLDENALVALAAQRDAMNDLDLICVDSDGSAEGIASAARTMADERVQVMCLVDSPEGVAAAAAGRGGDAFPVLIDVGYPGGRTGVRGAEEAVRLAELIAATDGVQLVGVSSYEGGLPTPDAVRDYLAGFAAIADLLRASGMLGHDAIVTAGGSAYFDIVASELTPQWADGRRVVLRSGAYVSHDDGVYVGKTPFRRVPEEGSLIGAVEVWAQVVSAPEPGFALVGMGKRDAPYDEGMPVPRWLRRAGTSDLVDLRDVAEVPRLDDQHGYLRFPAQLGIRPGDLVCFGISHPCTAFDKWRAIPVVDDEDRIVDVVRTYF